MAAENITDTKVSIWFDSEQGVRNKVIKTPNHFVSHMIEHIAWRLGVAIKLYWPDENWYELGMALGHEIAKLPFVADEAAALGMIDDGSAEIQITLKASDAHVSMTSVGNVDLNYFLNLRCEQLENSKPLEELLKGLSKGAQTTIKIRICSLEDTHHTWEGIFRAIGIAYSKCLKKSNSIFIADKSDLDTEPPSRQGQGTLVLTDITSTTARIMRETAESKVEFYIDLSRPAGFSMKELRVDASIQDPSRCNVEQVIPLLHHFCLNAGFYAEGLFIATTLSSSHVVMEDMGMVIGRAYLEVLKMRMQLYGANGAGSSIHTRADFENQSKVRSSISTEGRKFWKFVPYAQTYPEFKQQYLLNQSIQNTLFSEDLDDFIDGFAGGSSSSIIIGIPDKHITPDHMWETVFETFGMAVKESLEINPYRQGVPPGVKATLI